MYDPLALDRQRIEQERLRRRADSAIPTPRRPKRSRTHARTAMAAVASLLPHPRPAAGCTEAVAGC
jgi:hypothetical protein